MRSESSEARMSSLEREISFLKGNMVKSEEIAKVKKDVKKNAKDIKQIKGELKTLKQTQTVGVVLLVFCLSLFVLDCYREGKLTNNHQNMLQWLIYAALFLIGGSNLASAFINRMGGDSQLFERHRGQRRIAHHGHRMRRSFDDGSESDSATSTNSFR